MENISLNLHPWCPRVIGTDKSVIICGPSFVMDCPLMFFYFHTDDLEENNAAACCALRCCLL